LGPSQRAAERVIWTVEGDGPAGLTLRLRHAFLAHGAAQCGICTPGMLMAATDLLAREAAPSPAAVADAIAGVLCRCTGYIKIVEAILDTAGGTSLLPTPVAAGGGGAAPAWGGARAGQRGRGVGGGGRLAPPPMRCGCASCARPIVPRASRSAISIA